MIPDDVSHFTTDGERHFYGFLKTAAKPDSNYKAWYLPDINSREPDFIIYTTLHNFHLITGEFKIYKS